MSAGEKKGRLGEDAARLYLENKGFSFVAANLHVGHDEIDLLMRDGRPGSGYGIRPAAYV